MTASRTAESVHRRRPHRHRIHAPATVLVAVVLACTVGQLTSAHRAVPQVVGPVAVAAPSDGVSRPANGRVLRRAGGSGPGELRVENGNSSDAVVTLGKAGKVVRAVYVRSGGTTRVRDVPNGTYDIAYTVGVQWDTRGFRFRVDPSYRRFDTPGTFTSTRISGKVRYSILSVTLHTVPGGNATTSAIRPEDFPR